MRQAASKRHRSRLTEQLDLMTFPWWMGIIEQVHGSTTVPNLHVGRLSTVETAMLMRNHMIVESDSLLG